MIALFRYVESRLKAWKLSPDRKPLIIRGARQVGKSFVIRAFGQSSFRHIHEFNFELTPALHAIFEPDLEPKRILAELESFTQVPFDLSSSLIFLDEIQECPKAITALRYFFEKMPNVAVIAAGSLLEFALKKVSVPVGRVQYEYLYPLSFGEFLMATDRTQLQNKLPLFNNGWVEFTEGAHAKLLFDALREYMIVGGMPEAVSHYAEHRSFARVGAIHDGIIATFRDDVHKYARGDLQVGNLGKTLTAIFKYVGKEITYSTINPDDSHKRTKASLELLEQAQLISVVRSTNPSGLPLGAEASDKHFKCLFLDIGLGQRMVDALARDTLTAPDILDTYDGRLAEQFVGQQLLAESAYASERRHLYCWIRTERSAKAEVDYLIARAGKILPIEVKAGKRGRLRSLDQIFKTYPTLENAICLQHRYDVSHDGNIIFALLFTIL